MAHSPLAAALALAAALCFPTASPAQSVLDRSPNLDGAWTGPPGVAHFNFLHRFQVLDGPAHKIRNSPTFLAAYAPVAGLLVGTRYATASTIDVELPNEWQPFVRWAPLRPDGGRPFGVGAEVAWNSAATSLDGALDAVARLGRLRVLGTARAFEDAFGTGDATVALGGGVVIALGPVALAGDAVHAFDRPAGADEVAWGAGLQLPLPHTPHTISIQATNTDTGTLQGSSLASGETRYGFEFTIPLTLARYFGRSRPARPPEAAAGPAAPDTAVVHIRDLRFQTAALEVKPGTLVRWVNDDRVAHTVTFDDGSVDSGPIEPGRSWETVVSEAGEHTYHCEPHPFMQARVVVGPPEAP